MKIYNLMNDIAEECLKWLDSWGSENGLPTPEADLLPHRAVNNEAKIMSYAGIAQGLWGNSADDSDNFIRKERDSWERER